VLAAGVKPYNMNKDATQPREPPIRHARSMVAPSKVLAHPGCSGAALGKNSYRYSALLSKALAVQFDALNLVQRLGRQITLPAMWATDHRDVLDDEQILASAVATRHVTNAGTFLTTDVTDHIFSHTI